MTSGEPFARAEIRENADAEVPDGGGRPQCVAQGRIGEDLEQKVYVAGGTGHCPHGIEACGSGGRSRRYRFAPVWNGCRTGQHQPAGSRMEPPPSVPIPPGQ